MKNLKRILLMAITFALTLAACSPQPAATPAPTPLPSADVISEGHIYPAKYTTLSFQARGVVDAVNVKIGDKVKAGDVLLRLSNARQAEAQVVAAQQAVDTLLRNVSGDHTKAWQAYMDAQIVRETAQKKWDDINLRDIENRIEDRQKDVEDRQVDLEQAQRDFDKYKDLNKNDPKYKEAQDKLDHAQSDYDKAVKNLESTMRERDVPRANLDAALAAEAEAKHQYELGMDGPNADQLALLNAQLAAAQAGLANYVITAPFDGAVMDVNAAVGDEIGPETFAVKLADTSAWYVETSDLTELEVVKISLGQKASILPDALQDAPMTGTVEQISQANTVSGGDILYKVKLKLDHVDPRALWGMTVQVTFAAE